MAGTVGNILKFLVLVLGLGVEAPIPLILLGTLGGMAAGFERVLSR